MQSEREQTIADFGEQWTRYTDNDGFYGSTELLKDIFDTEFEIFSSAEGARYVAPRGLMI